MSQIKEKYIDVIKTYAKDKSVLSFCSQLCDDSDLKTVCSFYTSINSSLQEFLDSYQTFDIICIGPVDGKVEEIDINSDHKWIIKKLQERFLNESGMLFFATEKAGFAMDRYIRPGADSVTKMLMAKEERVNSKFQAFVFYA